MGLFSKIEDAKYSDGGDYLQEGVYRLEITKVLTKKTRKGPMAFIGEFKVLESDNPKHRIGSTPTWMVLDSQEPFLGNIKQFIATACGSENHDDVGEKEAEMVVSEANPLAGKTIRASAKNIVTKKGANFTKVRWLLDSMDVAEIAKAHAKNA